MHAAGAVLTGGASRRMGTDKALIEIRGVPMVGRVARALAEAGCRPLWCQGGDASRLTGLGLEVRPDTRPGEGPVAAIAAAVAHAAEAGADGVVVAACDLPGLTAEAVAELLQAADPNGPAALAVAGEPDLVSWWPAGSAPALSELLDGGLRSYRAALDRLGARLVPTPPFVLHNVNTPADLAERPDG
jgi:molybdopterin-guanine dinucleotide biosynthesis protein A